MFLFPPTIILRHRKENLKKCSLRGLETREDLRFFSYPKDPLPQIENTILLTLGAPPLSKDDSSLVMFLIDGTWRYAAVMERDVTKGIQFISRSIPDGFVTAYPRVQNDCSDPAKGLASIEALFIAYLVTGRSTEGLLDHYYWKGLFLEKNSILIRQHSLANTLLF